MSTLTDAEWSDVYATLPEDPEVAEGWELSLVRRTVDRIIRDREAALRAEIAAAIEAERDALQEGGPWDGCPAWSRPESDALTVAARLARGEG